MFKKLAATTGAILLTVGGTAQAQIVEWRGHGYTYDFTPQCAVEGFTGSAPVTARYTPPNIGSNGTNTRIAIGFPMSPYMSHFLVENADFPFSSTPAVGSFIGRSAGTYSNEPLLTGNRSPATISAATRYVILNLLIRNWQNIPNCWARASLMMQLPPTN